jgi:hypothetical protein
MAGAGNPLTFRLDGLTAADAVLLTVADKAPFLIVEALTLEGEAIMALSKEQFVPVDEGNLRASGTVSVEAGDVVLSYGGPSAPYALTVHENPRAGKTGGLTPSGWQRKTWAQVGQWKYLETPFLTAQKGMLERLGATIKAGLGL